MRPARDDLWPVRLLAALEEESRDAERFRILLHVLRGVDRRHGVGHAPVENRGASTTEVLAIAGDLLRRSRPVDLGTERQVVVTGLDHVAGEGTSGEDREAAVGDVEVGLLPPNAQHGRAGGIGDAQAVHGGEEPRRRSDRSPVGEGEVPNEGVLVHGARVNELHEVQITTLGRLLGGVRIGVGVGAQGPVLLLVLVGAVLGVLDTVRVHRVVRLEGAVGGCMSTVVLRGTSGGDGEGQRGASQEHDAPHQSSPSSRTLGMPLWLSQWSQKLM